MLGILVRVGFAIFLFTAGAGTASAQGPRQNSPGQFDYYVLSLSWAPSFCAAAAERDPARQPGLECGVHPYSFIVHGLWPQYESGFPENCQTPAPRLSRAIVSSMLDLMPSPRLVYSEWDRHGTCSGLEPRSYFETLRQARGAVKIPADYLDLKAPLTVTPAALEDAFMKANPGLARADLAIACDSTRLTEVRICLSKELKFRGCPDVASRTCRREQVLVPPVHGLAARSGGSG
jgi:ribonuclease T2